MYWPVVYFRKNTESFKKSQWMVSFTHSCISWEGWLGVWVLRRARRLSIWSTSTVRVRYIQVQWVLIHYTVCDQGGGSDEVQVVHSLMHSSLIRFFHSFHSPRCFLNYIQVRVQIWYSIKVVQVQYSYSYEYSIGQLPILSTANTGTVGDSAGDLYPVSQPGLDYRCRLCKLYTWNLKKPSITKAVC